MFKRKKRDTIVFTTKELEKLAAGFPPSIVNKDWDYETVIMSLALSVIMKDFSLNEAVRKMNKGVTQ